MRQVIPPSMEARLPTRTKATITPIITTLLRRTIVILVASIQPTPIPIIIIISIQPRHWK
jgi:hypothetical protein